MNTVLFWMHLKSEHIISADIPTIVFTIYNICLSICWTVARCSGQRHIYLQFKSNDLIKPFFVESSFHSHEVVPYLPSNLRQQCCAPSPVYLPGEVKSRWWWEPSKEHSNTPLCTSAPVTKSVPWWVKIPWWGSSNVSLPRSLIQPRPTHGHVMETRRRQES